SEANLALYRKYAQPMVRAFANEATAKSMRQLHPLRLQYELFTESNPFMVPLAYMASWVRDYRSPASKDNPFVAAEQQMSSHIVSGLDTGRDWRDMRAEQPFLWTYGSPVLQAPFGIDPAATERQRRAPKGPFHQELLQNRIAELKSHIPVGGLREAVVRAILYIGMSRGSVDERGFELVRRIRSTQHELPVLTLAAFKVMVREQFLMLLIDPEAALAAIPAMLPADADKRQKGFELVEE